jgi:hypothetical protein
MEARDLHGSRVKGSWFGSSFGACAGGCQTTGTSELRRSRVGRSEELLRSGEAAGRSGSSGVNHSDLQRVSRREPGRVRVLVFEMWVAEVGQTHLWLVR